MTQQGTVLGGRYRLLDVLGDGGMARVFRAQDERLSRVVAVKVLHEHYLAQPAFVHRFEQEARLAASLSHPNIVAIYDVDREDDTYYIVMEYVEGGSLKNLIARDAPLPLTLVVPITRQLGLALDAAHAHGVIHRDIKPENILLTPTYQVKVGDFGIARALDTSGQTATGMVMGSVSYFSPEQAQGQPATAESDLYSSGIVLYEMLTGHVPFAAGNPLATAMQHITQAPTPPRSIVPALPASIDPVVLTAIAKDPSQRYHSGAALGDALTAAAINPYGQNAAAAASRTTMTMGAAIARNTATARQPRPAPAPTAPRRRAIALPLALLLLLGGGVAYAAMHRQDVGTLFAGGPPSSPSATDTPAPLASLTPSGIPAIGGAGAPPSATPPTSGLGQAVAPTSTSTPPATSTPPPTSTPRATPRATHTPQGQTATARPTATTKPSPVATATAHPSKTPTPPTPTPTPKPAAASHGSMTVDIVTARGKSEGPNYAFLPVDPRDTFSPNVGQVYAIFHFHHLPPRATIEAVWTLPNGSQLPPYSFGTYGASGSQYLWAEHDFTEPGHYSVAAVVNGKTIGSHDFSIAGKSTPSSGPSARVAQSSNGKSHGQGRGHNHNPKGPKNPKGHGPKGNNNSAAAMS